MSDDYCMSAKELVSQIRLEEKALLRIGDRFLRFPRHIMFIVSTIVSLVESFLAAGWVRRRTAPDPA